MTDRSEELLEAVQSARAEGRAVTIAGTGSKAFLAESSVETEHGRLLSTEEHQGIVDYRPDELVVTVRSGTPLKLLKQTLAREGQMLPFDPPEFQGLGTIGGAVASGLAGPGRPWRGGVRDAVLGVKMINGLGEALSFGGQVMKNVAGFDVARLQAGAFGSLGVLLEVSLRLLPLPQLEQTRVLERDAEAALSQLRSWARLPLPLTGTAIFEGRLHLRLSGSEAAVSAAAEAVGGELGDDSLWAGLRDHSLPALKSVLLACAQVPPATAAPAEDLLIEWNGARRWREASTAAAPYVPFGPDYGRYRCLTAGGNETLAAYQARLKAAFDPDHLFNPELTRADLAA
ncbi:MAG: glycolate oxidase subunit GlcE [Pseudomonadota bacterium]